MATRIYKTLLGTGYEMCFVAHESRFTETTLKFPKFLISDHIGMKVNDDLV